MPHTHDEVAYPGYAYSDTHPDRIAVMAMLHGLKPAPVENCRVLEIGCNEGSNIIPMAYALPGSEFVGFDIAELPVLRAQRKIEELSLTNIRVFQGDIAEVGSDLGSFDYIIAHGIYAWIPEPVRDDLLRLCREHLAPQGIAFISYNALPGGHLRGITRDILMDRVAAASDPVQGVRNGMKLLDDIVDLRPEGDLLSALLVQESGKLLDRNPQHIFHDELSPAQRPVLFKTFAAHAMRHGLQYVSEAVVMPMNDPSNQPRAMAMAKELAQGDRIAEEQILDFVRMRAYRETLLCHAEASPTVEVAVEALQGMRFASQAEPTPGSTPERGVFMGPTGNSMETTDALAIVLLNYLSEKWPHSVSYEQLASFLGSVGVQADEDLQSRLLSLVSARLAELHVWEAPVSDGIEERPRASASSRQEAGSHGVMTTLHHYPMKMRDALVQEFLALLDGTRDRQALADALRERRPDIPESSLTDGIEMSLRLLYRSGVLLQANFRC